MAGRRLRGVWLGRRGYEPVLALQRRLLEAVGAGRVPPTLLLLEHEPVVTLGRGAADDHVLFPEAVLRARGYDVVRTDRGGDVTLHAPGQLVGYPIVDLRPDRCDVRRFVKDLTETMRCVAESEHVGSGPLEGSVGLWVDLENPMQFEPRLAPARRLAKLGAIGVRVSRWVTMHGFALNLFVDLARYDLIVPCGIRDHGVTSLEAITQRALPLRVAAEIAHEALTRILGAQPEPLIDWLDLDLDPLTL